MSDTNFNLMTGHNLNLLLKAAEYLRFFHKKMADFNPPSNLCNKHFSCSNYK